MSYLVFTYDDYYPCGGWQDLLGEFSTWEEAIRSVPPFSEFDLVEVNWEEKVFTEIDVYSLSPYRELWEEQNERAAAERRKASETILKAQIERAKKVVRDNEMGPEATNAFVEFLGEDR